MKKQIKKTWMIASALTVGMAVLTPLSAGAVSVETTNNSSITVQQEHRITGTITDIFGSEINLLGKDGKKYFISFYTFSSDQLEKMKLVEGQEISVEGSVAEDYLDLYTFEVYKKELPKEVTKEDLTRLEKLFNKMMKLQKELSNEIEKEETEEKLEKKYEDIEKISNEMDKIKKPYILANWEPLVFEEYMKDFGFDEANIVIKKNDIVKLKAIYNQWVKLEKSGQEEKANKKYEKFDTILKPYLDELYSKQTFEFEDYISVYDFKISEADNKQLKQLYEEALALEKNGEYDKSAEKLEEFNEILEPYFTAVDEEKKILIAASKVTINGKDYISQ